jgi:hypothetical protein
MADATAHGEPGAVVPQIEAGATYRLTNDYAAGKSLSVSKNGDYYNIVMSDTRNSPDRVWRLVSLGNDRYRLINVCVGDDRSLDTPKSGNNSRCGQTCHSGSTGGQGCHGRS